MQQPNLNGGDNINDVMSCLGRIEGKLDTIASQSGRTIYALIGLIGAMIGVKYLGTPILLEIATILAFMSIALTTGIMVLGWRLRKAHAKMTRTGYCLMIMLVSMATVQFAVYVRDMGWLSADAIYAIRIVQNVAWFSFLWTLFTDQQLFKPEIKGSPCGIKDKPISLSVEMFKK